MKCAVVPFAPPSWLTPTRIAWTMALLISASGAATALPLADAVARGWPGLAVLPSTMLLSGWLIARVLRAKSVLGAVATCGLAPFAGMLNAAIIVAFSLMVSNGKVPQDHAGDLATLCALFGGGAGLAFGAAFTVPLTYAVRLRDRPSHDGVDRMLVVVGLWTLALCLPLLWGIARELCAETLLWSIGMTLGIAIPTFGPLLVGGIRILRRKAWLTRVQAGHVPGWEIVPDDAELDAELLPACVAPSACNALLCRRVDEGSAPYRTQRTSTPLARVRRPSRTGTTIPKGAP